MRIGVPRERYAGEKRVATTPDVASQLIKLGFEVAVQAGAGVTASYSDRLYREAGCSIETVDDICKHSDLIFKLRGPVDGEHRLHPLHTYEIRIADIDGKMRDELFGRQSFDCPRVTGGYQNDQRADSEIVAPAECGTRRAGPVRSRSASAACP